MKILRFISCPFFLLLLAAPALAVSDWKPVDPADLSSTTPVVEAGADAEAIFWEVRVDDSSVADLAFNHYIRIKIFTERGRDSQSKVELPFGQIGRSNILITDIAARTIKPNGTIIDLNASDIFERTIVKANGVKVDVKSFAMPSVEPGAIIEYRWREVRLHQMANGVHLEFQRDIPVRQVRYSLRPYASYTGLRMRVQTFNGNDATWAPESDGFYSIAMKNLPAVREEPNMPPEDNVKTWVLVYYTRQVGMDSDAYWRMFASGWYEFLKPFMKVDDRVKHTASDAIADAATPEQKLERLFNYCRTKIKNVSDDASGMTMEDRLKLKANKSPSDTIKRGQGTWLDIDFLFAALAQSAGFDSRLAFVADRSEVFFQPSFSNAYFIRPSNIAVKVGDNWRFFDPGYSLLPFGHVRWQEEGQQALLPDSAGAIWVSTPISPPEESQVKRTAKLHLTEDGTLEGDVRIEYTGHLAVEKKEENDQDSPQKREQTLRDMIKAQMSTAELSNIQVENVTDPTKPFVYAFHIKVQDYAQRTGRRLFIQPAFFQHGLGALFQTSERRHPVYFHFPWSEDDDVMIDLPAGYTAEQADSPRSITSSNLSAYNAKIQVGDAHTIQYHRTFFFGGGQSIMFPATSYTAIKNIFDAVHTGDEHSVALKQNATASN